MLTLTPDATTTVQDAANAAGCSTTAVEGLSKQIVDEINCLIGPGTLALVPQEPNLVFSASSFTYLQTPARDDLVKVLQANAGMTMNVDSMLRTVAQQYLLYDWYKAGLCGIQLAATPGTSNHEQGLAFDTSDYNAWMTALDNGGFKWYGSADVVHFDYAGSGAVDLNGKDVLAFQTLWNLNNPGDMIAEDGQYGPETEARLQKTPADGFATGASCTSSNDAGAPPPKDAGAGDASAGGHGDAGGGSGSGGSIDSGAGGPGMDSGGGGGPMTGGEDASGTPTGGDDAAAPNSTQYDSNGGGCACRETPTSAGTAGAWLVAVGLALVMARRSRAP
ncbi:MAG TPA: M15 family metallopeptidase [Polyangiaceae bacterium]